MLVEQLTSAGKSVWSVSSGVRWMFARRSVAMLWAPLLIGAAGLRRAMQRDQNSQMIAAFGLGSLCAGFATIFHVGGDLNYFLPALAGCALLLPFAIEEAEENPPGHD